MPPTNDTPAPPPAPGPETPCESDLAFTEWWNTTGVVRKSDGTIVPGRRIGHRAECNETWDAALDWADSLPPPAPADDAVRLAERLEAKSPGSWETLSKQDVQCCGDLMTAAAATIRRLAGRGGA